MTPMSTAPRDVRKSIQVALCTDHQGLNPITFQYTHEILPF